MLSRVNAIRFDKVIGSGRTKPCLILCADDGGNEFELVVKFAAGCDMGTRSLVAEALTALLAADLDLPVPEPFLVRVESDFAATIPDSGARAHAEKSLGWNFGSKKLPPGFMTYPCGKPLTKALQTTAAEILAFDTFIANSDRRESNPNLLLKEADIAIYDHELALQMDLIIGWKPPWVPGGIILHGRSVGEKHVFLEQLRGKDIDLSRLAGAFEAISGQRLAEYRNVLPQGWLKDHAVAIERTLDYLAELRDNIKAAIGELKGALR